MPKHDLILSKVFIYGRITDLPLLKNILLFILIYIFNINLFNIFLFPKISNSKIHTIHVEQLYRIEPNMTAYLLLVLSFLGLFLALITCIFVCRRFVENVSF